MLLFHVILILFTLLLWCYYIILYSFQYIGWPTRIQHQAQATSQSRQSSRCRHTTTPQRQATNAVSPDGAAPAEGASSTSLNNATFERIVSAVSQVVLSSINEANTSNQPLPSLAAAEAPTHLVEMPVEESGSDQCTPVASALSNVIGALYRYLPCHNQLCPRFIRSMYRLMLT